MPNKYFIVEYTVPPEMQIVLSFNNTVLAVIEENLI
jgi:hypothetical protein